MKKFLKDEWTYFLKNDRVLIYGFFVWLVVAILWAGRAFAGLPPTTSKGNGDSSNVTTYNFQFPNISVTHTGVTAAFGVVNLAGGGTNNGSLAATAGGVLYTDGTKVVNVGAGTATYVLTSNGASAPTWNVAPTASVVQPGSPAGTLKDFFISYWGSSTYFSNNCTTGTCASSSTYSGATVTFQSTGVYRVVVPAGVCQAGNLFCIGNSVNIGGATQTVNAGGSYSSTYYQFVTSTSSTASAANSAGTLVCGCQ